MTPSQFQRLLKETDEMSHFELRDSLSSEGASSGFQGRVADVFAGLGNGLVKSDKSNDEEMKNIKGIY